jgi:hypothetical protein
VASWNQLIFMPIACLAALADFLLVASLLAQAFVSGKIFSDWTWGIYRP